MKWPRLDLPQSLPRDLHVAFLGKALARLLRLLQHLRKRLGVEVPLVERDPAFLNHAGYDAGLRRARAHGTHTPVAVRDLVAFLTHLPGAAFTIGSFPPQPRHLTPLVDLSLRPLPH